MKVGHVWIFQILIKAVLLQILRNEKQNSQTKKNKKTEKKTLKKEERLKKIKEIILAICKNFLFSTKVSNQESVTVETEILSKIQVPVKYTISI